MKIELIATIILRVILGISGICLAAAAVLGILYNLPKQPATQTTPQNGALLPFTEYPTINYTVERPEKSNLFINPSINSFEPLFVFNPDHTLFTDNRTIDQRAEDEHTIWHLSDQADYLKAENERLWNEMLDAGLYVIDSEITTTTGNITVTGRTYIKATPEPESANWQPFKDYAELETWLKAHVIGVLTRGDGTNSFAQDCDDYTELLINWAAKDGYQLMACPVKDGYVWTDYVYSKPGIHVGCWAWIGNDFYYIEPTENNKVTKLDIRRD